MNKVIEKFVNTATDFIGTHEFSEEHMFLVDTYNLGTLPRGYKLKYTDSWCAAFVSAVSHLAGCDEYIPKECSVGEMIKKAQSMGIWEESDDFKASVGSLICYHWNCGKKGDCTHWPSHVGIIADVNDGYMTVVEGNYNNKVATRIVPFDWNHIRGFITPDFPLDDMPSQPADISYLDVVDSIIKGRYGNGKTRYNILKQKGYTDDQIKEIQELVNDKMEKLSERPSLDTIVDEVMRGLWGNNPYRKEALEKEGYDYESIQNMINLIYDKRNAVVHGMAR